MAQMMQFEIDHQDSEERHSDYDPDDHNGNQQNADAES